MSFAQIVWHERTQIIQTAHQAFVYGMLDTWKRCMKQGSSPQEPDFVAGLVLESSPYLYNALRSIFGQNGIQFSLTAIFSHQTPKVQFAGMDKTSCELGDLLFVHVHTSRTGAFTRNALLYQAKMSSKQPHRVGSGESDQLRLYTDWPLFTYHRSRPLTGHRDITPKLPHTGAQYMLIDDRPPSDPQSGLLGLAGTYPIGSCMADQYLQDHNHLAAELFEFLLLRSGRGYADRASSSPIDDWSQVVWDLLSTGLQKAFTRRNSGRFKAPRHAGRTLNLLDGFCFARSTSSMPLTTVESILGADNMELLFRDTQNIPPSMDRSESNVMEPDSGVSVVLIETSELQDG
jgi:hypothetical protein